jgi:hypothetical protein
MAAKTKTKRFGRATRYVVVPVETMRTFNIRSNAEVIEAQKNVDDDMIAALEEMVNSAKAGRLEGKSALSMGAVAW